ncbi:hypothetical protein LTR22_003488 [Elasticomyces elasticus]|nr:hypothetical protein LTR22_003488 [Elasticomyces elasticus]
MLSANPRQRLANGFALHDRVFLAGDAVHTHSPKAGQGMNVSIHDTYNLVWKIGAVLNETAHRPILSTYQSERRMVAQQLIDFDKQFSRMFSGRPARDIADEAGISMKDFKETFATGNQFTSGASVEYAESILISGQQKCATSVAEGQSNLHIGRRFPSQQVVCQCDATPVQLGDALRSDGKWRLVVFSGDISHEHSMQRLRTLSTRLESSDSILSKPVLEPILVHSAPRRDVELLDVPTAFYSRKDTTAYDYYRVYADDESYHHGHGEAYEAYGVDSEEGLMVLVQPDMYFAWLGRIEDTQGVEVFLSRVLR